MSRQIFRDDRPVTGADLIELRERLRLSLADMLWLFGMSMNKWAQYTVKSRDLPVADETVEILARLLDRFPELSLIPPEPDLPQLLEHLSKIRGEPTSLKHFAILFGRQGSTGHRWISQGTRLPPALTHLAQTVLRGIQSDPAHEAQLVAEWERIVRTVGRNRGVSDVFSTGRWTVE